MKTHTMTVSRTYVPATLIIAAAALALLFLAPLKAQAAAISQQLDLGASNADVTTLQTFLAQDTTVYPSGLITGYFGNLTAAAVKRFQTANGLAAVGRVGPATLALINQHLSGSGGTVGYDDSAPIINPETVTPSSTSVRITWQATEAAQNRVMYGTTWPFLYATAQSVAASGLNSTANITIPGLQPRTTYYYTLESIDAAGNVMWTVGKPMTTSS